MKLIQESATSEILPPHYPAELIPLTTDGSGATAVSGRALHEFLGVKERYNDWLPRMLTYGFSAGQDFTEISVQSPRARGGMMKDHVLTLDMGKELSMIQRTDRGKAARQYFIEVEKQASAEAQNLDVTSLFDSKVEKTGGRPREDFTLTRFAAYLVAMNGDPCKPEVAAAQSYCCDLYKRTESRCTAS